MSSAVAAQRIAAQLVSTPARDVASVVKWFGAMQAQDYLGALWAVGLRVRAAVEADVERALAERRIVRSWPLRGTLHFIAAEDLRWVLSLTATATLARARRRFSELGLDEASLLRCRRAVEKALGGRQLTRAELYRAMPVSTEGQRGIHILFRLAHDGVICFGARRGKQQTFALLDEWVPARGPALSREEAAAELARRYFQSHAPATLQDFSWWSGLPARELRVAAEKVRLRPGRAQKAPEVVLLPPFDEMLVGYRDRSAMVDDPRLVNAGGGLLNAAVLWRGRVAGTWRRTLSRAEVRIACRLVAAVPRRALEAAAERYGAFVGLRASVDPGRGAA